MSGSLAVLPLIVIVAAVAAGLWQLLAGKWPGRPALTGMLSLSLAFPLGGGLLSLLHFVLLPLGLAHPVVSGLLLLALVASCWPLAAWHRRACGIVTPPVQEPQPTFPYTWVVGLVAIGALVAMLGAVLMHMAEAPHGGWDAWAIWTVKAKYLASGEPYWRNAIDPTYRFMHPEYPLLVPSLIAWCWKWGTTWHVAVPQAVALLSLLSLAGVSFAAIALLRGTTQGFLALLTVSVPITLVANGSAMYADIPMAAMLGAAAALIALSLSTPLTSERSSVLGPVPILAGALAGLCAWMKMEGILHIAALSAGLLLVTFWPGFRHKHGYRRLAGFAAGLLPVGAFLLWFRLYLPAKELTTIVADGSRGKGLLSVALDPARYLELAITAVDMVRLLGPLWAHPLAFLALAVVLLGLRSHRKHWPAPIALLAAFSIIWAGYCATYITSFYRIEPLMRNSFDRLLMHPWPMLVIIVFLATKTVEDWAIPVAEKAARRDRKRGKGTKGSTTAEAKAADSRGQAN